MTRIDHQIFFTALAYVTVCLKEPDNPDKAKRIVTVAEHIEDFCRSHINRNFAPINIHLVSDSDAAETDQAIEKHINELRSKESTILPQDKATLFKFFDRLQQRKIRRTQATFYEMASVEMLASIVLKHIDEEIEAGRAAP